MTEPMTVEQAPLSVCRWGHYSCLPPGQRCGHRGGTRCNLTLRAIPQPKEKR